WERSISQIRIKHGTPLEPNCPCLHKPNLCGPMIFQRFRNDRATHEKPFSSGSHKYVHRGLAVCTATCMVSPTNGVTNSFDCKRNCKPRNYPCPAGSVDSVTCFVHWRFLPRKNTLRSCVSWRPACWGTSTCPYLIARHATWAKSE